VEFDPHVIDSAAMYKLLIGSVVRGRSPGCRASTPRACATWRPSATSWPSPTTRRPSRSRRARAGRRSAAACAARRTRCHNVEVTREFVVNVVDDALAEAMNVTSGDYAADVDEFAKPGWRPPRARR